MKTLRIPACIIALCLVSPALPSRAGEQTTEQLTTAAAAGDANAQYRLAQALILGAGMKKDPRNAYEYIRKAADQGHADAIGGIGYFHANGLVVKKDPAAAAGWFRKGAEKGGPRSQFNLGRALLNGRGVARDEAEGLKWIDRALAQGLPYACFMKGDFHYRGEYGHPQDWRKARVFLEKAAEADNAPAQNMLGVIYEEGLGVACDLEQAEKWFRASAGQGDPKGMSNLGQLLGPDGPDASKHVEAIKWLLLAHRANEPAAGQILGEVLRTRPLEIVKQAREQMADFKPRVSRELDSIVRQPHPRGDAGVVPATSPAPPGPR